MRQLRLISLLLLLLAGLAACSPGHLGSNEIAFIRDGHLWTSDPDGANAFEVVSDGPPVIGYGWSPTHQLLVFRVLDSNFASTPVGKHLRINPLTGLPGDLPSELNTISIDGGTPIPILFSSSANRYSNAWWNPTGNRLLYRQEAATTQQPPETVSWWISQNDQPGGIARKALPNSFSIPSLSADTSMAIGNSEEGVFTTTLAGSDLHYVIHNPLPGHPLPASLERVLWQPAHQNPAILYAVLVPSRQPQPSHSGTPTVQLLVRSTNGQITSIATCPCTQFAWSPDGNFVLYSTGATYTVFNARDHSSFTISAEDGSIPYWSPDSQFLLLDGLHTLLLVGIPSRHPQLLLSDGTAGSQAESSRAAIPDANALLQPAANSPWAPDSRHFLFLTRNRLLWQGQHLSAGNALYTIAIDDHGQPQGAPGVVDTGNDSQPGWTYEDPNTSFLFE